MYGEIEWRQVRGLFDSGMSKSAIARRHRMSRTTVARLLAFAGSAVQEGRLRCPPQRIRLGWQVWAPANHCPAAGHEADITGAT